MLKGKEQHIKSVSVNKAFCTINISNHCNLSCTYCYRNKKETSHLRLKDLDTIIESIINNIYPNASEYSFSFSYTSESSLDLESLRYFDSLIAKYEGYLFSEKDFKEISPDILFDKLPNEIKNKYSTKIKNDYYIDILNQILQKEKLWLFFDYSNNSYLVKDLKYNFSPSISKTVTANRQITNHFLNII